MQLKHKPTLGLALSGGGARGLAHIGVLKVLEQARISVDFLAGTSMGGVIAAAYAAGLDSDSLESIALEYRKIRKLMQLADPAIPRTGLFQGKHLRTFFKEHFQDRTFNDLRIPLTLIAVDLNSGQEVHIREGSVVDALRATVSLPGLFTPVVRGDQSLVDGGLLNNLPVDVVRKMGADIVLAVDVNACSDNAAFWQSMGHRQFITSKVGGLLSVLGHSLNLLIYQNSLYKLQQYPPDFLLQPPTPDGVAIVTGFDRASELIELGVAETKSIISDLQEALQPRFKWWYKHRIQQPELPRI